jgi:hypothetical protein
MNENKSKNIEQNNKHPDNLTENDLSVEQRKQWSHRRVQIIKESIDKYCSQELTRNNSNLQEFPLTDQLLKSKEYFDWKREEFLLCTKRILETDWYFMRTIKPPDEIIEWYWYYSSQDYDSGLVPSREDTRKEL